MDVEKLKLQIESAFAGSKYPHDKQIVVETIDDEGTSDFFSNTDWKGHLLEKSGILCSSLWFFTPKAFCYFVPAFMLASLRSKSFMDECWGNLIAQISPAVSGSTDQFSERAKEIVAILTREQRQVISRFLEFVNNYDVAPPELSDAIKALSSN